MSDVLDHVEAAERLGVQPEDVILAMVLEVVPWARHPMCVIGVSPESIEGLTADDIPRVDRLAR